MSRNRTSLITALAVATTIALTGCGGTGAADKPGPTAGSNAPDDDVSDLPVEPEPEAEPDPLDYVVPFGETFTWEDGLAIRVDPAQPYTLSDNQFREPLTYPAYSFTITVINGTAVPFDPVLIMPTVTSGNQPMLSVYDSANGILGAPTTPVLPGAEVTWPNVFEIADPAYIVLEVNPGLFDYEPLIVTNANL